MFAYSLAWELGLEEPLKFETKSDSAARDLFYTYDALKRFHDAQSGISSSTALPYITYHALGLAMLYTQDPEDVAELLPREARHARRRRSVVLIDEVDKAPRDFPNDILNELELLYFRVPELGDVTVEADPALQPIVIITSNSEKDLPDAFLRRCIYYNIPFPSRDRLETIVAVRLGATLAGSPFLDAAMDLFFRLRAPSNGLLKKPATAEILGWLLSLQRVADNEHRDNPLAQPELARRTLSSLVKTAEDQQRAAAVVDQWMNERQTQN
jgi:MoxR-like ATPase